MAKEKRLPDPTDFILPGDEPEEYTDQDRCDAHDPDEYDDDDVCDQFYDGQ